MKLKGFHEEPKKPTLKDGAIDGQKPGGIPLVVGIHGSGLITEHDARQLEACDRSLYVKGASNVSAVEDGLLKCGSRADRWGGRGNDNASEYGERCGEKMLHNLEELWKYLFEPHEEEEVCAFLHPPDERGLVDIVEVLQSDALEVLHAVRYLLGSHALYYSISFIGGSGMVPYGCRG